MYGRSGAGLMIMVIGQVCMVPAAASMSEAEVRYHNIGKAKLEDGQADEAAKQFLECIRIDPKNVAHRLNAAMCYLDAHKPSEAVKAALKARQLEPDSVHAAYILGIAYKRQTRIDEAVAELERVVKADPGCVPARFNLAKLYRRSGRRDEALGELREVVRLDPAHAAAHYMLFREATVAKDHETAKAEYEIFERLSKLVPSRLQSSEVLEESKYTRIIEQLEAPTTAPSPMKVAFADVTAAAGIDFKHGGEALSEQFLKRFDPKDPEHRRRLAAGFGSGACFLDYNADGLVDVYITNAGPTRAASRNMLYRNTGGGKFKDVTAEAGVGDDGVGLAAAAGDYDNDGHVDLYLVNAGPNILYRNKADGTFENVTAKANVSEPGFGVQSEWVDFDHDADLDIYVVNYVDLSSGRPRLGEPGLGLSAQSNVMFRNNGDGTFTDVTAEWNLAGRGFSRDVAIADIDGRNDTDFVLPDEAGAPLYLANLRYLPFADRSELSGLSKVCGGGVAAVAADVDNDLRTDLCVLQGGNGRAVFLHNLGPDRFTIDLGCPTLTRATAARDGWAAHFADIDNDGFVDLLVACGTIRDPADADRWKNLLFRNNGDGTFADVSDATGVSRAALSSRAIASADYDNDGDLDILIVNNGAAPTLLRNDGGNANRSLKLRLVGTQDNRMGVGAKIEARTGLTVFTTVARSNVVDLGVGQVEKLDVVRLRWPNGVTQTLYDVRPASPKVIDIKQRIGVVESCPFLFAFDGRKFVFRTDLLDGAALGYLIGAGRYWEPCPEEYVRLDGSHLQPRKGFYSLRITQELREITYLDKIALIAVDHPRDLAVYVDNSFGKRPPFVIRAFGDLRPPVAATDHMGRDVLALIRDRDRVYLEPFGALGARFQGLASVHCIVLDLGPFPPDARATLLLTGWPDWTNSTVNYAVSQNRTLSPMLPRLDVIGPDGRWHTVKATMGLPAGMDKTMLVDLSGTFPTDDHRVRITTNLTIYWDQVLVSTTRPAGTEGLRRTALDPLAAHLRFRGYSASRSMARGEAGPLTLNYDHAVKDVGFDHHQGRYTRYGPVGSLLTEADDCYVIFDHGDELAVEFPASMAPGADGLARTYFVHVVGWIKDGDFHTRDSQTVEPLPSLSGDSYPRDELHRRYAETFNQRIVSTALSLPARGPAPVAAGIGK